MQNDRKSRAPGAGRPLAKPDYEAKLILGKLMKQAVAEYRGDGAGKRPSLATIAERLDLNPIKVRKLLITAGVYVSEQADSVKEAFLRHKRELPYKAALAATASELKLSKSSVTSYLPYEKVVYMKQDCDLADISVNAERMRLYRNRHRAMNELHIAMHTGDQVEERLWKCIVLFQKYPFLTATGLPFQYALKTGRHGEYTKELWVDRMENGKPLVWSSVWLAFQKAAEMTGEVERPKAIGNIRGISYIYPILWKLEIITVPQKTAAIMARNIDREEG